MLVTNTTANPVTYPWGSGTRIIPPRTSLGLSGAESDAVAQMHLPGVEVGTPSRLPTPRSTPKPALKERRQHKAPAKKPRLKK